MERPGSHGNTRCLILIVVRFPGGHVNYIVYHLALDYVGKSDALSSSLRVNAHFPVRFGDVETNHTDR